MPRRRHRANTHMWLNGVEHITVWPEWTEPTSEINPFYLLSFHNLTHCGLVTPYSVMHLGQQCQVMAWCHQAPSQYLILVDLISTGPLWTYLCVNCLKIQKCFSTNCIWKHCLQMSAILFKPHWVKLSDMLPCRLPRGPIRRLSVTVPIQCNMQQPYQGLHCMSIENGVYWSKLYNWCML